MLRATSTATVPTPTTTARSTQRSNSASVQSGWPLYQATNSVAGWLPRRSSPGMPMRLSVCAPVQRSEEHTSELQSHHDLVCRLLLEKKKKKQKIKLHT